MNNLKDKDERLKLNDNDEIFLQSLLSLIISNKKHFQNSFLFDEEIKAKKSINCNNNEYSIVEM